MQRGILANFTSIFRLDERIIVHLLLISGVSLVLLVCDVVLLLSGLVGEVLIAAAMLNEHSNNLLISVASSP